MNPVNRPFPGFNGVSSYIFSRSCHWVSKIHRQLTFVITKPFDTWDVLLSHSLSLFRINYLFVRWYSDFCLKNFERLKRVEFRYEIEKRYKRKLYRARVAFDAWSFKNERGRGRYTALGYPRKLTSLPNERTCKVVGNFIKYLREPLLAVESCLTNRPSWRVLTSCVCKSNGNTIINEQTRTYEHRRQLRKKFLISKERWNKKKEEKNRGKRRE